MLGCSSTEKTTNQLKVSEENYIKISESDRYLGPDLINPPDSIGFQYSSYNPITFDELIERGYAEENSKGMKIFNSRNKMMLKLFAYPTKDLNADEIGRRNTFSFLFPNMKSIIHIYDSKLKIKYKDQYFLFIFQSQLIPYLKSEAKIGDLIGLYLIHATYDEFSNTHLILVNEFNKY
ncbi:hypothetical protein [Leptospira kanakyensis]|uniref:hypothetical protein n=1 Tax=Leptospira kanakyensis TaxID=2484968 RepID=UPI00223CEDEA|nr:hypothetical protein [Leptospira kanakyensis]MCW7469359.1 hypothetical protein [Leptospira kanakyensis]